MISSPAAISRFSCSSSLHRGFHLYSRSCTSSSLRSKVVVFMSRNGHSSETSNSQSKATLRYTAHALNSQNQVSEKPLSSAEEYISGGPGGDTSMPVEKVVTEQKGVPKSMTFVLGFCLRFEPHSIVLQICLMAINYHHIAILPFSMISSGLVLSGGLTGFIFSRNPATLITGVLSGGALLALSTFSLKVWRQGKSSLPFILGQAVLAATLLWKKFLTYSLTKKLFPTGFYAVVSAAMLCFNTYVVMSGGNPPPKKLRSSAAVPS